MKRWIAAAIAVTFVGFASPDSADAQASFGIGVGPSFPTGDLGDVAGTGFHGGITADFSLPLLPVGLRGDLMFQQFPIDGVDDNFQQLFGTVNGTFGLLPLPMASVYLTGGIGLYADTEEWDSEFGINGGVGARLNLIAIRPFLEARYHTTFGDQSVSFIPITIGLRF